MQFAARMLFQNCRRCLTVDCNWPAYQRELAAAANRMGGDVVTVSLRDAVLHDQLDLAEITGRIASACHRQRCDGVFLPLVDPWGIRLPVREIIQSVQERCATRFVVVDAAQALGHVELDSLSEIADFVIAGTHKWVGSYFPIGVGLAPNPRSQRLVAKCLATTLGGLNDGLLQFLNEITHGRQARTAETVNLGPLVAACGAWGATPSPTRSLPIRLANADRVAAIAVTRGWSALRPHRQLHSGSLLLQSITPEVRCLPADRLTMLFAEDGIHLTAYEDGVVRLAMPERPLPDCGIAQLATAFSQITAAGSPVTC